MSLTLKPETEALIATRMKASGYSTADDLVRAALDVLHQVEDHAVDDEELAEIRLSLDQIDRGEVESWEEVSAPLRAKYDIR